MAGAHQLGLYSTICTNPDYAKEFEFEVVKGFALTALALNCGVYSFDNVEAAVCNKEECDFLKKFI